MAPPLLEDLKSVVKELEATFEAGQEGRRLQVQASFDLRTIAQDLLDTVDMLGGLVRYRFGEDTGLMAAWDSARNVFGPVRHRDQETPEAGEPAAGDDVAPAA